MLRLLKPLEHYKRKYGTEKYGLNKLYLMMEKQHNRGQEGAGMACVRLGVPAGHEYMYREKAEGKDAITKVFGDIARQIDGHVEAHSGELTTVDDTPSALPPYVGELYMGHLRYSTTGKGGLKYVHPFLRRNNWKAKNLCLCGNFNMTNVEEVFNFLTSQGQSPRVYSDTYILLELMGHRLDREAERNYDEAKRIGLSGNEITQYIDSHIDISNVLRTTMPHFDGGYCVCGLTGSGEMFAMRDPNGIRPAFYYADDEIVAIASERPVLQTTFNLQCEQINEIKAGEALIVNSAGRMTSHQIIEPREYLPCSFERIYFSRGNDRDIYQERKQLGRQLAGPVLKAIDNDVENTIFSYIPNTAETAYYGLIEGIRQTTGKEVRAEKVVSKDIKLRTFITEGNSRNDLAAHVYDISYGTVRPGVDNLVVIDDSIVRGTTLRESIIRILDRLKPKKLVIVSSAPQIRYPDFYGIDMSNINEFIAFQACKALMKDEGREMREESLLPNKPSSLIQRPSLNLYPYSVEELNRKMVELLRPEGVTIPIELVYQSIEGLHKAIPNHPGDWYFTGHYPTPGGRAMLRAQFIVHNS